MREGGRNSLKQGASVHVPKCPLFLNKRLCTQMLNKGALSSHFGSVFAMVAPAALIYQTHIEMLQRHLAVAQIAWPGRPFFISVPLKMYPLLALF